MADTVENENKESGGVMDNVGNFFGKLFSNKPEEKPLSEAEISEGGGNPMYGGRKRRRKSKRNKRKGRKTKKRRRRRKSKRNKKKGRKTKKRSKRR